jgi:LPXTG-motif cell wall-anchored protein
MMATSEIYGGGSMRSLIVLLVLGSAMAIGQDAATPRTTPNPVSATLRQGSEKTESYYGWIGLLCLLGLAGLGTKTRKKESATKVRH